MSPSKTAARDILVSGLVFVATLAFTGEFEFTRGSPATGFAVIWAFYVVHRLWSYVDERRADSRQPLLAAKDLGQPPVPRVPQGERVPRP